MIQVYKEVLHGDLTPTEAKKKVQSDAQEQEVFVTPTIIKAVLNKYLAGVIDHQQLSEWAAFLTSHNVYVTEGWEDDTQADKYEPMWEILQQLSTPFIDGLITKDRVEGYISQLSLIETLGAD